ncbi:MAG: hypothetical protein L0220_04365 [Acidobacteria bacterium]|nr:hypothetical protein [Acidobacteriota bacterium]
MKRYSTTIATFLLIILIALIGFESPGVTQTKRRQRPKAKTPTPTPTPVIDMRAEANQVADQIKNVTRFIYIYGKITNGLEIAEGDVKNPQTTTAVKAKIVAKNTEIKNALVTNINDLKIGLDAIARKFQPNPKLTVQYLKISYAIEETIRAQQLANAGKYDDAGKALITTVERLTDTITSMRMP